MTCPLLEYRSEGDGRSFDAERAYCTAVDAFVQPMRADICNDRYELHHAADCEIYREHAADADGAAPAAGSDGAEPADEDGGGE